jgi:hypothetical protein
LLTWGTAAGSEGDVAALIGVELKQRTAALIRRLLRAFARCRAEDIRGVHTTGTVLGEIIVPACRLLRNKA